jgi:hypothetical protein
MQIILVIYVNIMSLFKTDILKQYLYHNRANTAFTVFIFKCQTLGRNIISEIFTHFGQSATQSIQTISSINIIICTHLFASNIPANAASFPTKWRPSLPAHHTRPHVVSLCGAAFKTNPLSPQDVATCWPATYSPAVSIIAAENRRYRTLFLKWLLLPRGNHAKMKLFTFS